MLLHTVGTSFSLFVRPSVAYGSSRKTGFSFTRTLQVFFVAFLAWCHFFLVLVLHREERERRDWLESGRYYCRIKQKRGRGHANEEKEEDGKTPFKSSCVESELHKLYLGDVMGNIVFLFLQLKLFKKMFVKLNLDLTFFLQIAGCQWVSSQFVCTKVFKSNVWTKYGQIVRVFRLYCFFTLIELLRVRRNIMLCKYFWLSQIGIPSWRWSLKFQGCLKRLWL